MSETEKLLPCPVCGETPEGIIDATKVIGLYRITHRCKVWPPFSLEGAAPERVAALWNTRTPGWQPIESAPKDSKARLVWCPAYRNVYIVSWVVPLDDYVKPLPEKGFWAHFGAGMTRLNERPTMWQPLPPAPQGEG